MQKPKLLADRTFFGANNTSLRYSEMTVLHIKPRLILKETTLFETKWWDYRFLHPMEATYLFADCYVTALRAALAKRKDARLSTKFKPFRMQVSGTNGRSLKTNDFLKSDKATITGMWSARQAADARGIPYEFWCAIAMKVAEACDWAYLPRPTHLYSEAKTIHLYGGEAKSMVEIIEAAWLERMSTQVVHSNEGYYKTENRSGLHAYQLQHVASLVKRLKTSQHTDLLVSDLVYRQKVVPENLVFAVFGKEEGERIIRRAKRLVA